MTNVPIPGGPASPTPKSARDHRSRTRFYASVAALALGGVATIVLAVGEPWRLTPETMDSTARSVVATLVTFMVVAPAFAFFQYDRARVGAAWHEPAWRPSSIGLLGLLVAVVMTLGWHGLRLAFYVARLWTGSP